MALHDLQSLRDEVLFGGQRLPLRSIAGAREFAHRISICLDAASLICGIEHRAIRFLFKFLSVFHTSHEPVVVIGYG